MDAATLDRIFEPFFTTKDRTKGTGLGLSMVFGAIQACRGHIDIETAPGAGTTFRIVIPAEEEDREVSAAAVAPASTRIERTVLLVEDELLVRISVSEYLLEVGMRVLAAANAAEALQLASATDGFDLLLTDVVLPEVSGPRLAGQLRERFPDLPVLFMSAHRADQLRQDGRVGDDAIVLEKPFEKSDLIEAVRALLGVDR